jgi:hypothetical protein
LSTTNPVQDAVLELVPERRHTTVLRRQ